MSNKRFLNMRLTRTALALVILSQTVLTATAADNSPASVDAWTLYSQQKYSASADAFDELIRSSKPNPRLYYYAALANRSSSRLARARQLCKYIVTNFPSTTEAAYAQKLYPDSAPKAASVSDGLPESLKGKSIQELMKSEEGRKAVEEALAKKE